MRPNNDTVSLYLHIPFCARKCVYCDFNTYAGMQSLFQPLVEALAREIESLGASRGRPHVHTIFLGGGTPTVLHGRQLARLLDACRAAFDVDTTAEITSEANPGTVDRARFGDLAALGVNRLSMGVQSFDERELKFLGRIHEAVDAEAAFDAAREAGFSNINLDFIFGLPGQARETWQATLQKALALRPEHLSLYSLIVEEGTPLSAWVKSGRVAAPDDDLAADMYDVARARLAAAGYEHYEISNWARRGAAADVSYQARHNLTYWRNQDYLGVGPGAFSSEDGHRWSNVRGPAEYVRRVNAGASVVDWEETSGRGQAMSETMMLGLRLVQEGVDRATFAARFGADVLAVYPRQVEDLQKFGRIEVDNLAVRLTPQAVAIADRVAVCFVDAG